MSRFHGVIGYGENLEVEDGVWVDVITEREYFGDVTRNARKLSEGEYLNKELTVGNTISIVADPYAFMHFHDMRYISWAGALWMISDVEDRRPRLQLRLGGVYNGPTPADNPPEETPDDSEEPDNGGDGSSEP